MTKKTLRDEINETIDNRRMSYLPASIFVLVIVVTLTILIVHPYIINNL